MAIPKDAEGNLMGWVNLAKKKAQRIMDSEWEDINDVISMVQKQSVAFDDVRCVVVDVKSYVESATKRQEATNDKLLEMISKVNDKIDGKGPR